MIRQQLDNKDWQFLVQQVIQNRTVFRVFFNLKACMIMRKASKGSLASRYLASKPAELHIETCFARLPLAYAHEINIKAIRKLEPTPNIPEI